MLCDQVPTIVVQGSGSAPTFKDTTVPVKVIDPKPKEHRDSFCRRGPSSNWLYIAKPYMGVPIGVGSAAGTLRGYLEVQGKTYAMTAGQVGKACEGAQDELIVMQPPNLSKFGVVVSREVSSKEAVFHGFDFEHPRM
jgi:hypothetical protein